MKHIQTFIKTFLLVALLASCTKDKGNYNYQPINDITIEGVDSFYLVDYGHRLQIRPKLTFSKDSQEDPANYTFEWIRNTVVGFTGAPLKFADTRDLDTLIKMNYGSYYMYYRVTDKRTGVFKDAYFIIQVTAPSYEGWLLLCDLANGNSRLDMVARRGSGDTLYRDILSTVKSSLSLTGTPSFVATANSAIPPSNGTMSIFVATSDRGTSLGRDSMDYLPSYHLNNSMVNGIGVSNYTGAKAVLKTYGGLMWAEGDLYAFDFNNIAGPVNTQDNGVAKFRASPYMAVSTSYTSVVFNEDNKTFLRHPYLNSSCLTMPAGTLFNFSTGKNLLYMDFTPYNGGEAFAILEDAANSKRYLARMTVAGVQRYYAELNGTGASSATNFAVSPTQGYLFYAVGSKIYEYDFSTGKTILMKDYGTRKISLMQFLPFANVAATAANGAFYTNLSRKLIVCTYEESNLISSGSMDLYTVPDINGPIELYRSYTGSGKVVSVAYRER